MLAIRKMPETERRWLREMGTLNGLQAWVFVAQKALEEGRGGISRLSRLTGTTTLKGPAELRGKAAVGAGEKGKIRRPGAARKGAEEADPAFRQDLVRILEETTARVPISHLKWTNKSPRMKADELGRKGPWVSYVTVARRLRELGYSLHANGKTLEGPRRPDRDEQFRYINKLGRPVPAHQAPGAQRAREEEEDVRSY